MPEQHRPSGHDTPSRVLKEITRYCLNWQEQFAWEAKEQEKTAKERGEGGKFGWNEWVEDRIAKLNTEANHKMDFLEDAVKCFTDRPSEISRKIYTVPHLAGETWSCILAKLFVSLLVFPEDKVDKRVEKRNKLVEWGEFKDLRYNSEEHKEKLFLRLQEADDADDQADDADEPSTCGGTDEAKKKARKSIAFDAADRLAKGLFRYAACFTEILNKLDTKKIHVFGEATLSDGFGGATLSRVSPKQAEVLLFLWKKGQDANPKIPMDALWGRNTCDCEIAKKCLAYDEFHHLELIEPTIADARHAAVQKVNMVKRVAQAVKVDEGDSKVREQWRRLARNWLCHRFESGRFRWHDDGDGGLCVKTHKGGIVDLQSEVDDIIRCVEDGYFRDTRGKEGDRYKFVRDRANPAWGGPEDWCKAVRMAMSGSSFDEIMFDLEWDQVNMYEFFLAVANQRSGPRLRNIWAEPLT